MAKRKTIVVEKLLKEVNDMLKNSTCEPDVRNGMCAVLESVLHSTGNYNGYRHLCGGEVPSGHKAGVHFDENRLILPYPDRFKDTDNTRRLYH
jgi:hypothetical protein